MNPATLPDFAHSGVNPRSPADSIIDSVRALNVILKQLSGPSAIAALRDGDACANVDVNLWAPTWEGARTFRDQFLLNLARMTRDEWRRDIADIIDRQPEVNRPAKIDQALDARLRVALDFSFRFLVPRQVCFLGDALSLAFESEMAPSEFARELASSASRARNATPEALSALVLGASGMHRFQPERLLATGKSGGSYG